jgi:hypothetical protein
MGFGLSELGFQPGIFANRSARASKGRWIDGNLVRFSDSVPAQVGGWRLPPVTGVAVTGRARDILAWRPNNQIGRYAVIGTNAGAYVFDGGGVSDITPVGFVAGRVDTIAGNGYGGSTYGTSTYGTPRTGSGLVLTAGGWTFDMFGEIVLGCGIGDGTIYEYLQGTDTKFKAVTNAPKAAAICVSDERHVFAFGCNGNPNLVMWCDREQRTVWTPAASNRAGSYDMQATSPFQCGKRVAGVVAAWTQTEAFVFTPLANSLVYSNDRIGTNCGVMGPHAVVIVNDPGGDVAYWMGPDSFFVFDGAVRQLPCDLWDYVFKDLNILQRAKFQARANTKFNEIWFFYCSGASTEIDRAITYCYANGTWSKANLSRLVWLDKSIFSLPIAVDASGKIYEHETGTTTDTGAALGSFVRSSPLMVGSGQAESYIDEFWPDLQAGSGSCTLTFYAREYPGQADTVVGPFAFTIGTEKIEPYLSARQVQIEIAGVSGHWELGVPMMSVQGEGGR